MTTLFGQILKEMGLLQEDLFNGEPDEISQDDIKKQKRKASSAKAAQTRKANAEKKNSEISNLHVKAMTNQDLFGNKNSKEEQDAALNKLKSMTNKKKK